MCLHIWVLTFARRAVIRIMLIVAICSNSPRIHRQMEALSNTHPQGDGWENPSREQTKAESGMANLPPVPRILEHPTTFPFIIHFGLVFPIRASRRRLKVASLISISSSRSVFCLPGNAETDLQTESYDGPFSLVTLVLGNRACHAFELAAVVSTFQTFHPHSLIEVHSQQSQSRRRVDRRRRNCDQGVVHQREDHQGGYLGYRQFVPYKLFTPPSRT